jgi:hypothetical protein
VDAKESKPVHVLEMALIGTLVVADMICIRLWFIMGSIREALTDPMAMAFIITEGTIKSDSKKAEQQLDAAQHGFKDTEGALVVFTVCVAMITLAMVYRITLKKPQVQQQKAVFSKKKKAVKR